MGLRRLLLIGVFLSGPALGCDLPDPGGALGLDDQIASSTDISVARVVSATVDEFETSYNLVVLRRLRGPERARFTVTGGYIAPAQDDSFERHTQPRFWQGKGRFTSETGCGISPRLVVGTTYLVFADEGVFGRSFEMLETIDGQPDAQDRWLRHVDEVLRTRGQLDRWGHPAKPIDKR